MKHLLYIIYSKKINKYYIGITGDIIEERIRRHNSNHKGFTGKTNDWEIVYTKYFENKKDAIAKEKEIKSWKSRLKIEKLIKH